MNNVQKDFNKYRYLIIINFKFLFISRVKYLKQ